MPACRQTGLTRLTSLWGAVREALRLRMISEYEQKVADYQAEANRAHKERDWEGATLCRHMIGEASRFLESLRADRPHLPHVR